MHLPLRPKIHLLLQTVLASGRGTSAPRRRERENAIRDESGFTAPRHAKRYFSQADSRTCDDRSMPQEQLAYLPRLCYRPMTLLVGGSIASAVWFVSHHRAGSAHRPFPSWMEVGVCWRGVGLRSATSHRASFRIDAKTARDRRWRSERTE
jgi:hypothetical protein